jgi:hypothetical protein
MTRGVEIVYARQTGSGTGLERAVVASLWMWGWRVFIRAVAIWFAILVVASLNGALRDLVVAPRTGDTIARAISTVILCGLILLVTWYAIAWVRPGTPRQALGVGALWLALTLGFEFGAGRYAGKPWSVILADYDVMRGRIWVLVPIITFLAPYWVGRTRGLWSNR